MLAEARSIGKTGGSLEGVYIGHVVAQQDGAGQTVLSYQRDNRGPFVQVHWGEDVYNRLPQDYPHPPFRQFPDGGQNLFTAYVRVLGHAVMDGEGASLVLEEQSG